MFSVVIPLYNKELSIGNTIQSVLDQTFQDFEIVIVNDGSTDNSVQVVEQFDDPRIRVINKPNGGVSSARNRGIEEANREWIAFLDGDDIWEKNHLVEITRMMQVFPGEKVYSTSYKQSDGQDLFKHPRKSEIFIIENYFKEALRESLIWTGIVVVHKDCFENVGYFNEQLNRGEDLDMWARLAREYKVIKSSVITAIYRLNAENRSDANFDLSKSRIYNYDFSMATSNDEATYYKREITMQLLTLFKSKDFQNYFKLHKKHAKYITFIDLMRAIHVRYKEVYR